MKQLISFIIGIIIIPLIMISLLTCANWILAQLFSTSYISLQHSNIWIFHTFIIIISVVIWFIFDPIVGDWDSNN